MSGPAPARTPAADRSPAWPWLLVLVLAVAAGVLLAWRPWAASGGPRPDVTPAAATSSPSPAAEPSPPGGTTAPGAFDGATAAALFLTDAELAEAVPMADGMSLTDVDGAQWGLPVLSTVDPPSCTPAVTIVDEEPAAYLRRFASDDTVTVVQSVAVLPDAATAQEAFDALVETLGSCGTYQQSSPGTDGGAWTAGPPTTERGAVSTVVRRLTLTAEGASSPEVEVTALAGNALVTTSASGVDPGTDPADPTALAGVARSSAERALAGLG
ncbi:sensor domain-containing protein [Cellulomonas pakistanensis]|uniref:PknH-like extracellular domain-containing protein n=1 Tax=Cellulomonas pakistanensis TaxID=992287 RepID=A0A919U6U1_9CELL|nr:sensor domain-containing protein [Cellulomonas pakistanensis]GIG37359.1 hypothetical protein Cpa01nite_27400 [Cellulomonas pakistanensis]